MNLRVFLDNVILCGPGEALLTEMGTGPGNCFFCVKTDLSREMSMVEVINYKTLKAVQNIQEMEKKLEPSALLTFPKLESCLTS